jgi:hypothetical protein
MTGPGYDALVGLHVLSAVVGFGAVGVSGTYAARARSTVAPRGDDGLRRYFHAGANWAERSLFLTPVLGAIVLWAGDSSAVSQAWPWIGLGCWVLAVGIATGLCWPAERRIQTFLADAPGPGEQEAAGLREFREACTALQRGASAISLCFLVAVVAMIWQPR